MARVAANQDRSEALRKQYVYKQQIHILTHKPGGKLMREETGEYNVVPNPGSMPHPRRSLKKIRRAQNTSCGPR